MTNSSKDWNPIVANMDLASSGVGPTVVVVVVYETRNERQRQQESSVRRRNSHTSQAIVYHETISILNWYSKATPVKKSKGQDCSSFDGEVWKNVPSLGLTRMITCTVAGVLTTMDDVDILNRTYNGDEQRCPSCPRHPPQWPTNERPSARQHGSALFVASDETVES